METDIHAMAEIYRDGEWGDSGLTAVCAFRNYDVFAVLAGVRNGYGFAGIPTGSGFAPISPPRGIPADASPEFRQLADAWAGDGHSHSYITLAEILAFDWTQTTTKTGVMEREVWEDWQHWRKRRGIAPDSYFGEVSGPRILVASAQLPLPPNCTHVRDSWNTTYMQTCSVFWINDVSRLLRLGSPESVRLMFFFDN